MAPEKKNPKHEAVSQEGVVVVRRTAFGQEVEDTRTVDVRPFIKDAPVGSVTVKKGRTINMGNYESARVDVEFTVPGYVPELVDIFRKMTPVVDQLLEEESENTVNAFRMPAKGASKGSQNVEELL